jgi:hypothetical protein
MTWPCNAKEFVSKRDERPALKESRVHNRVYDCCYLEVMILTLSKSVLNINTPHAT